MASRPTSSRTCSAQFHSAERYTGVAGFDSQASQLDATGNARTESCTEDFGRRKRENRERTVGCIRHVRTSDAGSITRRQDDGRTDGGSRARPAATENSADRRGAGRAFDAGSSSHATAANSEAHGLHRGHGGGTGQRDLAKAAAVRKTGRAGLFRPGNWTRRGSEYAGRDRSGHERRWTVSWLSSVSIMGWDLPGKQRKWR